MLRRLRFSLPLQDAKHLNAVRQEASAKLETRTAQAAEDEHGPSIAGDVPCLPMRQSGKPGRPAGTAGRGKQPAQQRQQQRRRRQRPQSQPAASERTISGEILHRAAGPEQAASSPAEEEAAAAALLDVAATLEAHPAPAAQVVQQWAIKRARQQDEEAEVHNARKRQREQMQEGNAARDARIERRQHVRGGMRQDVALQAQPAMRPSQKSRQQPLECEQQQQRQAQHSSDKLPQGQLVEEGRSGRRKPGIRMPSAQAGAQQSIGGSGRVEQAVVAGQPQEVEPAGPSSAADRAVAGHQLAAERAQTSPGGKARDAQAALAAARQAAPGSVALRMLLASATPEHPPPPQGQQQQQAGGALRSGTVMAAPAIVAAGEADGAHPHPGSGALQWAPTGSDESSAARQLAAARVRAFFSAEHAAGRLDWPTTVAATVLGVLPTAEALEPQAPSRPHPTLQVHLQSVQPHHLPPQMLKHLQPLLVQAHQAEAQVAVEPPEQVAPEGAQLSVGLKRLVRDVFAEAAPHCIRALTGWLLNQGVRRFM